MIQGSAEWLEARLGVPTASRFSEILTPTGQKSKSAIGYMDELIFERVARKPDGDISHLHWLQHGTETEAAARAWYEWNYTDVEQVGFVLTDHGYGCSPDGLVGDDGLLEIKSTKGKTAIGYTRGGKLPSIYKPQVQGQMLVCKRDWCDFLVYHIDITPLVIRVERDEAYINTLHDALCEFVEKLETEHQRYMEAA